MPATVQMVLEKTVMLLVEFENKPPVLFTQLPGLRLVQTKLKPAAPAGLGAANMTASDGFTVIVLQRPPPPRVKVENLTVPLVNIQGEYAVQVTGPIGVLNVNVPVATPFAGAGL